MYGYIINIEDLRMKKLLIYYSYTGNCEKVREVFETKGYEIRKVENKKKLPKSFFLGMMTGGFLAGIRYKDKLVNFDNVTDGYDEIVIATPIWNGRFCSVLNGILNQVDLTGKQVTFVFTAGSGAGPKALKRVNKEYPEAKVIFLKEPKKYPEELKKL